MLQLKLVVGFVLTSFSNILLLGKNVAKGNVS